MAKSKHQQILQKIEHKQKDLQMYSNEAENREMEGKSILKQKEILEREIKQLNDEIMSKQPDPRALFLALPEGPGFLWAGSVSTRGGWRGGTRGG